MTRSVCVCVCVRVRVRVCVCDACSSDIDECSVQRGLCRNGQCLNTVGTFYCVCGDGYELSTDGRVCNGAATPRSTQLIRRNRSFWPYLWIWPYLCLYGGVWDLCVCSVFRYQRVCGEPWDLRCGDLRQPGRVLQVHLSTRLLPA